MMMEYTISCNKKIYRKMGISKMAYRVSHKVVSSAGQRSPQEITGRPHARSTSKEGPTSQMAPRLEEAMLFEDQVKRDIIAELGVFKKSINWHTSVLASRASPSEV